jgi:hypothetical protein
LWLITVWFSASTFVVKIATFAKPETVSGKASIFMNLPVAPFYVMPPDKAAAIKILLYR